MTDTPQREVMECDVLIVGAGPAGLSAAIRLGQLARDMGRPLNVVVVEKGSEVGAHILSGAVLEPKALNELIPDWKSRGAPLNTPVTEDHFHLLFGKSSMRFPTPPQMKNHGNYIISLGMFCRWLAKEAEALGAQIFPGFPAAEAIIEDGQVKGIITGDFGIGKNGEKKPGYQPGMELRATHTLFAEGCRGSLAQQLMERFALRSHCDPQTYGIGIKELWEIDPAKHQPGKVMHSVGWPLPADTYGGSFLYHLEGNKVAVGFVVGLDYTNPHLDPYRAFQTFKTHPAIAPIFAGGRRISYGARALNEGGAQSIPTLGFPGGALIGCAAGFLNVAKIKGTHTAMKSGMLAAEAAFFNKLEAYEASLRDSWVYEELHAVRNIRPAFHKGLWAGLLYAAADTYLFRGNAPWTFRNHADHLSLRPAATSPKPVYAEPDGKLVFSRMDSVFLSNTNHEEDQPCHLHLKDAALPVAHNLPLFDAPEQRYCPAGVYEIVGEAGAQTLRINAQNCVHCKTCDIKDPSQNIVWKIPEGGGGPNYGEM